MSKLTTWLGALFVTIAAPLASAQSFSLAPLPYSHDALAPVIDEQTMRIHHGRHHQAYVDNLNKAVAAAPALAGLSLEALMAQISKAGEAVRNNGGGHWNHTFFWQSMTRPGQGGSPSPELLAAINRDFGSFDQFKAAFRAAGLSRFGSGWAWLIVTSDGKLKVSSTLNQDNPLMDIVADRGQPLLGNDVWEHAYYLQYQNRRADYLDAWWQVVDWSVVSRRYADTQK
ncbi:MAG: superoxide dismutase [Steroidobacteraceae bacterium]